MENSTAKDAPDESIADDSLNEFFNEEWDGTDVSGNIEHNALKGNNIESNRTSTSSSGITENQNSVSDPKTSYGVKENRNSDPDNSLDEYFNEEWSYENPICKTKSLTNVRGTSSSTSSGQKSFSHYYSTKQKKTSTTVSNSLVIDMIKYRRVSAFSRLLNSNCNLTALNEKGQTALHLIYYARAWNLLDLLDTKFSQYPKIVQHFDLADCEGLTHLHIACNRGSLSLVVKYLRNKNDINACYNSHTPNTCNGFTALHFAMINPKICRKEIVSQLIKRGAKVNATDSQGRTPLHIASRILLYEIADQSDSLEVMDILVQSGSDIDAKDSDGNTPLLSVFSQFFHEFAIDHFGYYPDLGTHISIHMPKIKKKLQFFLQRGVDVTASNEKNKNVLHLILENLKVYRCDFEKANYVFDDGDHCDMIERIFTANPKIDLNLKNDKGETPLQMAVACMSPKIVELLLDRGADLKSLTCEVQQSDDREIDFFSYPDLVPIFEPVQDLFDVLELLSTRGFDLSLKDKTAIMRFFLHEGIDCACRNSSCEENVYRNTKFALHYASKDHAEYVVRNLYGELDLYEGPGDPDNLDVYNDERLEGSQELYEDLQEYLDTTRLANVHCNEEVLEIVCETIDHILSRRRFEETFNYKKYVKKDLSILKATKFENNMSLLDVLKKDPRDTPRSIVNEFDLKLIENLHCYKDAIKARITKARVRFLFEKYSSDCLKLICNSLPDVCCRILVNYLDNKDILNLCLATPTTTKN